MTGWHTGPMLAVSIRTTRSGAESARILTACAALIDGSGATPPKVTTWQVDPGVPVSSRAAQLDGTDPAQVPAERQPAPVAVAEIAATLAVTVTVPIVAYRANYALTVLDRECRRHGVQILGPGPLVIDPAVIDRHCDPFRRGRRHLAETCRRYGLSLDRTATIEDDAIAAARLAQRLGQRYPALANLPPEVLHARQTAWHAEQAANATEYLTRRHGQRHHIDPAWPIRPVPTPAGVPA